MKTGFIVARLTASLAACLIGSASLHAAEAYKVPSFLKELDDLDEVMSEAAQTNKGVTFLLMSPGST
tara:strand:- start:1316 stop:1516 length:201 start_codon:yes stop_codon:yes gene_type:complete